MIFESCIQCVMDLSDPEITFDANGICSHCHEFNRQFNLYVGDEEIRSIRLKEIIGRIKRARKGKYDCVIGVSGGVDSSYVAHLLVAEYGLRPLAVHVDNGWNSNLAVTNIHRVLDPLKIDLQTEVLNWKEFRELQVSFIKASVPDLEIPTDHAITAVLMDVAKKNKVKFILGGSNVASEGIMPAAWSRGMRDWRYIRSIQKMFGVSKLSSYPHFTIFRFALNKFWGQKWIEILNYVDYNKFQAIEVLTREYGWHPYPAKHGESVYTRFLQNYYLPQKFGADKRRGHYSSLICAGQMTRDEALEFMSKPIATRQDIEEDISYVLKKLGLERSVFENLMQYPRRSINDYPNYESTKWFQFMQFVYRQLRDRKFETK